MWPAFPSNHYVCRSPDFQEAAKHLPANGKQKINSLFCFACACSLPSHIKLSWSWTTSGSHVCPSDSLPHPLEEWNKGLGRGLAASWGQPTTTLVNRRVFKYSKINKNLLSSLHFLQCKNDPWIGKKGPKILLLMCGVEGAAYWRNILNTAYWYETALDNKNQTL